MAPVALFIFSLLTHLVVLHSTEEKKIYKRCPPFYCHGMTADFKFPFKNQTDPPECGLFRINCSGPAPPRIQLKEEGYWHEFESSPLPNSIIINDKKLQQRLESHSCNDQLFNDLSLPSLSPVFDASLTPNLTLFKCNNTPLPNEVHCKNDNHTYYYTSSPDDSLASHPPSCSIIQIPTDTFHTWSAKFTLRLLASEACEKCYERKGECLVDKGKFKCSEKGDKLGLKLGLGIGCPVLAVCLFLLWRYKQKLAASNFLSRNISSQPHTNSDIEGGVAYFGVPVFTYTELEEATNHFDSEKELGDGGFGTVYYGKLKDGREVAVKRLYEHNYKRVEQFMNEIEILTRLRHPNLVSLYGCTSRHSRELLLVYEYIPNGTVADHLHSERADTGALAWPLPVDICRHRDEINLANLAVSKIQKGLFNELVDQRLGFESDGEVRRMVIAVAELAFQCLQLDNDMRPTMCEVLEALKTIESGNNVPDNLKG
ncbi:hypothetical protein ACE6H2_003235 [Prunus campanulata]